jgi:hypothetical protein
MRLRPLLFVALITAAAVSSGCQPLATPAPSPPQGGAHFPGGPRGCWDLCRRGGMEMASFVYNGTWGSTCLCRPMTTIAQTLVDPDELE